MTPGELNDAINIDYVPMELINRLWRLWCALDNYEYDDSHREDSLRIMNALQHLRAYKYPIGERRD